MVQVGAVDAPITTGDVDRAITEWQRNVGQLGASAGQRVSNGIDFLGWEFAFELNEVKKQEAAANNIDVRFMCIPREVLEKKAVEQGDIQFFELAALDVNTAVKGQTLTLMLNSASILSEVLTLDLDAEAEVVASSERWVNVDELNLARELWQQAGQHVLLIAPDQAVAPVTGSPRAKQVEATLAVLHALINRLHILKRQGNPHWCNSLAANLVALVLAIPQ